MPCDVGGDIQAHVSLLEAQMHDSKNTEGWVGRKGKKSNDVAC